MRTIDADALMKTVFNDVVLVDGEVKGVGLILAETVDKAPTIDAVPVVRCRECVHHDDEEIGMVYCPNMIGGWVVENWFCADGERKEGAD